MPTIDSLRKPSFQELLADTPMELVERAMKRRAVETEKELMPLVSREALHLLGYFGFGHLRPELANVSRPFGELAADILATTQPGHPEQLECLRKLLEAKDCAVRAFVRPLVP